MDRGFSRALTTCGSPEVVPRPTALEMAGSLTAAMERFSRWTNLVDVARIRHPGFMVLHDILLRHGLRALLSKRADVTLDNLALRQRVAS